MRVHLSRYGRLLAASLLLPCFAAYGGPGHSGGSDRDGPAMGVPTDHGNHGGNSGDHPSGGPPSTPPGNSGGIKVKAPSGTCPATSDDSGLSLQGPDGQSGASQVAHTVLTKIDSTTGAPVASASSATLMYFWFGSTFDYVLNAHQLEAGSKWTLTYQPEPLPSAGVLCLGSATVNGGRQLHLASSVDLASNLPPDLDPAADPSTQPADALLALVPSADVDCTAGTMTNFEPDAYLWTGPRVRYIDTDLLPAVQ